jgi:hypothetical protein
MNRSAPEAPQLERRLRVESVLGSTETPPGPVIGMGTAILQHAVSTLIGKGLAR